MQLARNQHVGASESGGVGTLIIVGFVGAALTLGGTVASWTMLRAQDDIALTLMVSGNILFIGMLATIFTVASMVRKRRLVVRARKLKELSRQRGMQYKGQVAVGDRKGFIFDYTRRSGSSSRGVIYDLLTSGDGLIAEIGTISATGGFIALRMPRKLPHMLLDSKRSGVLEYFRLQEFIDIPQQTQYLEGDFPQYFTLYAPNGYETDVRYLFTPDVMAALVDSAKQYEVEVVDDVVYLFTRQPIDLLQPGEFDAIQSIASTFARAFSRQASRYEDRRALLPTEVHGEGTRLKRRLLSRERIWVLVGGIAFAAVWSMIRALVGNR